MEFLPNTDGLLHVSEIAYRRIENVADVLNVGDKIKVKLIEIDEKTGKYRLSHRALLPKPEGYEEEKPRGNGGRNGGGNRSNGGGRENRGDRGPRPNGGDRNRSNGGGNPHRGNSNQHDGRPHRQERRELPDFPDMD